MVAKTEEFLDGVYVNTYYPMHKCTETDYENFGKADERIDKKSRKCRKLMPSTALTLLLMISNSTGRGC